jgi:outer membrane protein TolC
MTACLKFRPVRAGLCAVLPLLLAGCAAFSPDGGMDFVASTAGAGINQQVVVVRSEEDAAAARATTDKLLKRPLSADAAVQIALLNNKGLQAAYNELGIAEAAKVQASLLPNPTFSIERISGSLEIEIEKRVIANILALATLPARADIAATRFRQAQLRAAEETLRVAAETRRAYYRAVASRQAIFVLAQAKDSAETATQLSKRLGESGALSKLNQARDHVFYAEITAQLATARQRMLSERERLIRSMGLWGGDLAFKLPDNLPTMPRRPQVLPAVEVEAVKRRVDIQIARLELEALAKSYGLTQATRFVNLLEAAAISRSTKERATGETTRDRGFEVELQIPIFDFGEVRVRQAEQTYLQAVNRLAEKAVNARSQAREAYRSYRATYDIAAHYRREVLPLRKVISEETLLRYNAMQIDVFALLTEVRQRTASIAASVDAQRDFWLASVDLGAAVLGGGAGTGSEAVSMAGAAAAESAGGH